MKMDEQKAPGSQPTGADTKGKKKSSSSKGITVASIVGAVVMVAALVLISVWVYRNNTPILGTSIITSTQSEGQGASSTSTSTSVGTGSGQGYKLFQSTDPDEGYGLYGYYKHNDFFNVDVLVIKPQFKSALEFSEGVAAAQDNATGLWGYIGPGGQWVIQPQYTEAASFSGGEATVTDSKGKVYSIDASGNQS